MSAVNKTVPQDSESLELGPLDRSSSVLLHDQVAAAIRRAISEGEAGPGQRLPQARDLAHVLGVNTNTVLRAIRTLCDEGILEAGRGKATTITGTPERSRLIERARELMAYGTAHGFRRSEIIDVVSQLR